MATFAIAEPSATISDLIAFVVELRGHTAVAHNEQEVTAGMPDALIVDPAWAPGRAFAQRLRKLDASLPVVCVSSSSPTSESHALAPVAYLRMPFRVAELNDALDAALGLTSAG